ncbi:MAG: hypothetical protein H7Z42_18605 [Roseiflexaceae bacterium]|nr:hypothetical protein [Roseiflexaceae bacterium]
MTTESPQISEREREILRLVATGATNQQIAQSLHISINTVKVHLRNIFGKIGAASRTEATVYAMRVGLVEIAPSTVLEDEPDAEEPPDLPLDAQDGEPLTNTGSALIPLADPPRMLEPAPQVSQVTVIDQPRPARRSPLLLLALLGGLVVLLGGVFLAGRTFGTGEPTASQSTNGLPPAQEALAAMPQGRAAFGLASFESNGRQFLYALGGSVSGQPSASALRYDTQNDQWSALSDKPTATSDVQAAVVGGLIYVPGGRLADGTPSTVVEAYDPQSDRWTARAPLPAARSGYALAAFEGKLYLFGGWDGSAQRGEVFRYNPDTDSWDEGEVMPTPRSHADAVVAGQSIYVIGGEGATGPLAVNERFAPAQGATGQAWLTRLPLPQALGRPAIGITTGDERQLYVLSAGDQFFVYNLDRDAWKAVPLPSALAPAARIRGVGNQLYLIGGRTAEGESSQSASYRTVFQLSLPAVSN